MPADFPYDDETLLRRVAGGNEKAFNQLFAQHRNHVYIHALTYTKSPELAEELVLDIFLKIWNDREKLLEVENFRGYLFILSRNQVISAMRKQLEQPLPEEALALWETPGARPDGRLEFKETQALLARALGTLSPQQRTAFTLSRHEGKTYEEIAGIMGISRRTVNFHIVGALNNLRQFFHQHAGPLAIYIVSRFLS